MVRLESQMSGEINHRRVLRQDLPDHLPNAVARGPAHQAFQQVRGDSEALEVAPHEHGKLGDPRIGLSGEPRHADGFAGGLAHGDQCHVALVVDLRELGELRTAQLTKRGKEPQPDLLRR